MFPTVKRAGWGTVSRVLGPWTDYFPVQTAPVDSQIGVAIATEIPGGARGATVKNLHIETPANVAGTLATIPWRLLILRGSVPQNLEPFQRALQGYPALGAPDLPLEVLFERVIASQLNANNATAGNQQQADYDFISGGPSVNAGEIMSVILLLLNNETGVPGYGANNKTFVSLSVWGIDEQILSSSGDKDTRTRSIARGSISGL